MQYYFYNIEILDKNGVWIETNSGVAEAKGKRTPLEVLDGIVQNFKPTDKALSLKVVAFNKV